MDSGLTRSMMRERKYSSCTLETGASWESFQEVEDRGRCGWSKGATWDVETVTSSHDSGFVSQPDSSCWPNRFPGWPEEEDVHSKDRRKMEKEENLQVEKPDLLDRLIQEDFEERLEQMKQEGASSAERNFLNNLMKLLELQNQLGDGQSGGARGGVPELSWPQPQQQEEAGGGGVRPILGSGRVRSYPAQVNSLNNFLEQEVPLAFPGQQKFLPAIVPVAQQSPAVLHSPGTVKRGESPAAVITPTEKEDKKFERSRRRNSESGGGSVIREEMQVRISEVTHQLQALVRERKECEQELIQRGMGSSSAQSDSSQNGIRSSEILKLNKLLGDVRAEHEKILVMVRTLEVVNNVVHSKSLHDNLTKWKNIAIDVSNMLKSRQRGGEGSLTSEIVKLGQSIRRIRTLLWTLTASLPSQSGLQELQQP